MRLRLIASVFVILVLMILAANSHANPLPELIKKIKPSVVGVGLYDALGAQQHQLRGTGFVIGNGRYVVTNYHVISQVLDPQVIQYWEIYSGSGQVVKRYKAEIVARDPAHDLAILHIPTSLPALALSENEHLADGSEIFITGFPIGAVLGLYPATHQGIVAAATPDALPSANTQQLDANLIDRLKKPFLVYQLDITAFPGNSGSPVYDVSGKVSAILNKVFVSAGKESVLSQPSGISYAIPIKHLRMLAGRKNISL